MELLITRELNKEGCRRQVSGPGSGKVHERHQAGASLKGPGDMLGLGSGKEGDGLDSVEMARIGKTPQYFRPILARC